MPISGFSPANVCGGTPLNLVSLGMHFAPRQARLLAALVYGCAAAAAGISLWIVLSSAFSILDAENRARLLVEARPTIVTWATVACFGTLFAVLSMRFDTLGLTGRRAMLATSVLVAVVAGVWLEWWQSLYFVLPVFLLALAYLKVVHA